MNYEQKYKEALERARKLATDLPNGRNDRLYHVWDLESIFPELKESEDEKIRKELIAFLERKQLIPTEIKNEWIAWLEKQATPQLRTGPEWVNTIDDACDKRYSEEYAHGEYCHEQSFKWGFQEGVEWLEKQGEQKLTDEEMIRILRTEYEKGRADAIAEMQKPEWSEEDEKTIDEAISLINTLASGYGEKVTEPITFNGVKMINDIKERLRNLHQKTNHWKPSEEQINELITAMNNATSPEGAGILESLYNEIIKL